MNDDWLRRRSLRLGVVVVGLVLEQFILFGPSLVGNKILLPLDLLAGIYLPRTAEYRDIVHRDNTLSDLVLIFEFSRRFAATEFRAGRLPLWNPYVYAGAPFATFAKYSPFMLLYYLLPSPLTLAWMQLIKSLVAGGGAYVFARRVLRVGFWPAAFAAWCYPLTGFFVLWQGYDLSAVTAWYPWVLLCTDSAVRRPRGYGGPALAAVTCLTIVSGNPDVAAQVLLASGLYAVWCLIDVHGRRVFSRPATTALATVVCAWILGCLVTAPYALPLAEYARQSARLMKRGAGVEELDPAGLAALPQIVLPRMYGTGETGSIRIAPEILHVSSAVAYTGLLATLLAAPLAWCSKRHQSLNTFWVGSSVLVLGWILNIPGLVGVFRLPFLNVFSHYRWVFVVSFAILAMAVTGLEVIGQGPLRRQWWFPLLAALGVLLGTWCLYRSAHLPEPVATQLQVGVQSGHTVPGARDAAAVERIQHTFRRTYLEGAVLCGLAVAGWLLLWLLCPNSPTQRAAERGVRARRPQNTRSSRDGLPSARAFRQSSLWSGINVRTWFGPVLGTLLVADLLWFAYGVSPQSDRRLYYPRINVLERLAQGSPGRILGVKCFPPHLNMSHGLRDIRGYDGIDPARLIELLDIARDKRFESPFYALTQLYVPLYRLTQSGQVHVSPVLDMLDVRQLIFRGRPPDGLTPPLQGDDYWVLENVSALPRVYVPRRVETVPDGEQTLNKLAAPSFDPRQVAYVEQPVSLAGDSLGTAEIVEEVPRRVNVSVNMQTAGLVVLSDLWDNGWRADVNGVPVPILRTNYALRGVQVPAGSSRLVFRYEPSSFTWGLGLMVTAGVGLLLWVAGVRRFRWRPGATSKPLKKNKTTFGKQP